MNKSQTMSRKPINIPIEVEYFILRDRFLPSEYSRDLEPVEHEESARQGAMRILAEALNRDMPPVPRPLRSNYTIDPWELRKQFLSWNPEDWKRFSETVGILARSEKEFAEWQGLVSEAMVTPPSDWQSLSSKFGQWKINQLFERPQVSFQWAPMPIGKIRTGNPLRAIIATIQLDVLSGSQFRYCARKDCKAPVFELESRHERIYCSTDCAHLVAVRNSRARAQKPKRRKKR
jgi:hypothetical protein